MAALGGLRLNMARPSNPQYAKPFGVTIEFLACSDVGSAQQQVRRRVCLNGKHLRLRVSERLAYGYFRGLLAIAEQELLIKK
jgi:hypothetical protein